VSQLLPVAPRRDQIATRLAETRDLPFLDQLQKAHGKALGFFPRAQMEGYVANQWVLIAEDAATRQPLGYCASRDRYLKRDELGVIYQLCVAPGHQRGLIGATLIRDVFNRAAYGCRLFCCWCAQDLEANHFWESLGFVPIAFRGGSGKKKRVHIFWQRRIREGDATTPWWFPAKTDQGAMREDRLVLPIPPGLHWSDPMPVLKSETPDAARAARQRVRHANPDPAAPATKPRARVVFSAPPPDDVPDAPPAPPAPPAKPESKPARPQRPKEKLDPQLVAKARELRDRYLEQVNDRLLLASSGKYDVSRALMAASAEAPALPLLRAG
jgi:ribosomal protein S18 acetylase RimI-like enzyme